MTSASWSTLLVVTVNTILFHAMPRFSRPDILFAVTVPEAFAAGAGRTLVARYRAIVWSGAAAAIIEKRIAAKIDREMTCME